MKTVPYRREPWSGFPKEHVEYVDFRLLPVADGAQFSWIKIVNPKHMPYPKTTETKEAETSTQNLFILTAAHPTSMRYSVRAWLQ
jgi:hypothetical protein